MTNSSNANDYSLDTWLEDEIWGQVVEQGIDDVVLFLRLYIDKLKEA